MSALTAAPGETLAGGDHYVWLAFEDGGRIVAACYRDGGLVQRDARGWWRSDLLGHRVELADDEVDALRGTAPPDWPVLAEQEALTWK